MLTGVPPFPAAPLSETYRNIRAGHYPEPAHLSPAARSLIARLLAPDPAERPSLDLLLQDSFFTQGFSPDRLPGYCCHSPPLFARPPGLGGLLRKVQLLLPPCGPPCPHTSTDGSDPDSTEWGGEASPSERGAPDPETPIRLLSQGTLGGDPAGPAGSPWVEVDAAIRTLQLCLDAGPRALQDPPGEPRPTLWAPQWVDYSSKYGFGYQLSDGGSAVLFRDGTHMALRPPAGQVCYLPSRGRLETFALRDVPSPLGAKLAVLRLLTHCLRRRQRREVRGRGGRWGRAPALALTLTAQAECVRRRAPCPHLRRPRAPASACCASSRPSRRCSCCSATAPCRSAAVQPTPRWC